MENKVAVFEQNNMMAFLELQALERQSEEIEARKAEVRGILTNGMEQYGITSIDNDIVTITYVSPSESTTLDTKKLRAQEPKTYNDLMKQYAKTTKRRGYVKIKVK